MNYSWIAVVLSVLATFPQLSKTISTGQVRDWHPWTPAIAVVANGFLALHGSVTRDFGLVAFGLWFVVYNSVILYYKRLET
jgi:uncharacterized protein with PQ loop repeat